MSSYSSYKSKTGSSLLKDNSWIRRNDDEDEDIDRDPNYAKTVLSGRSSETTTSIEADVDKPLSPKSTTSVHALTKRFGGSQDELRSSSTISSTKTSYTKSSTYSSQKLDSPTSQYTTTTKTTVIEEPKSSTKTTTVTKDGKTTETTITTTQSLRSPVTKSPTKTETFTERVKSSSKGPLYSNYTPSRTTKVTEKTVTTSKEAEDKLYDTLIPTAIKSDSSPTDSKTTISTTETVIMKSSPDSQAEKELFDDFMGSKTVSSTETVTVKSSSVRDDVKTRTTTRTSSSAEDDLYGTLLPKSITDQRPSLSSSSITKREIVTVESSRERDSPTLTSPTSTRKSITSYSSYTDDSPSTRSTSYTITSKSSDDYNSDNKRYSYSRPDSSYEYSSITTPTSYTSTSYRSSSRSEDGLTDPIYSKSSTTSVYGAPERTVLEKDLCTYCHKPFTGDAKMVLDDVKINCHATCFKCDVCHNTLGNLKAGDSIWIYKRSVHCENCFEDTREKWRR